MKKMKKVLAMLLSLVMIVGLVAVNGGMSAKASNELGLSNFEFTSGYYEDARKWTSESVVGKEFSTMISFRNVGGFIKYALTEWTGLCLQVINNDTIRYTDEFKADGAEGKVINFTKEQAGLTNGFMAEPFKLTFTLEVGNWDDDTSAEDFKLGIYFNDNLLNDEYIYGYNEGTSVGKGIYLYRTYVYNATDFVATDMDRVSEVEPFTEGQVLKEVTLSDFGRQDGAYYSPVTAGHYGVLPEGVLDTVLSMDVMFEPGGYLRYPMRADETGINLKVYDDRLVIKEEGVNADGNGKNNDVLANLIPSDMGFALVGNDLNLKVAVECIDENEDDILEVSLRYYINDILVYDTVVYDDDVISYIAIDQYKVANRMLLSDVVANNPGKVPVMQQYTPSNLGLTYKMATQDTYSTGVGVVEQVFTTDLKFHTKDASDRTVRSSEFSFANALSISYKEEEGIVFKPSNFKLEGCEDGFVLPVQPDERFNLKISLDKVDCDNDGYSDDLKIGIFVNDKLCSRKFYYAVDGCMKILGGRSFVSNGVELIAPSQVPTTLREYSHLDFGFEDKEYTGPASSKLQASGTILNTLFTTNITVNSTSGNIHIQYGGDGVCWRVQYYPSGTIKGWNGNETYFAYGAADLQEKYGVGKTFKLQISVEEADTDLNGDGKHNDIRVGYFLNGYLVDNKFYTNKASADNVYSSTATSMTSLTISRDSTFSINLTSDTISYDPEKYTEVSIHDFGFEDGTYNYVNNPVVAEGTLKSGLGSINNKALRTKAKFSNGGSSYTYLAYAGSPDSGAHLRFGLNGSNGGSGITRQYINKNDYGYGNVQNIYNINGITHNAEVELMITTRFVNGDLQYGIWVDGKLSGNRFYTIRESAYKVTKDLCIYDESGSGKVKLGEDNPLVYSCLDSGDYEIAAPASGTTLTLDGVAVTEATTISLPGARVLETVKSNFNGMKTIVSYRQNDVNQDNAVTILDLVSMKRNEAGQKEYDIVALAAASISEGEKCGTAELNTMRNALVK